MARMSCDTVGMSRKLIGISHDSIIVLVVINIPGVISFIADINEKFMVTTMTLLMFPT